MRFTTKRQVDSWIRKQYRLYFNTQWSVHVDPSFRILKYQKIEFRRGALTVFFDGEHWGAYNRHFEQHEEGSTLVGGFATPQVAITALYDLFDERIRKLKAFQRECIT